VWSDIAKNTTAEEYCRVLTDVTDVSKLAPQIKEVPLESNVKISIVFCVSVMVVNIICYIVDGYRRTRKPPLFLDEIGVLCMPTWRNIAYMWRPAVLYTLFYIVTLIGLSVFFSGYTGLKNLMDRFLRADFSLPIMSLSCLFSSLSLIRSSSSLFGFLHMTFFCAKCRWRTTTLPEMRLKRNFGGNEGDLSGVDGMAGVAGWLGWYQ
jgi:hypothetical protein